MILGKMNSYRQVLFDKFECKSEYTQKHNTHISKDSELDVRKCRKEMRSYRWKS